MYTCKHFKIQELVSKLVYDKYKDFAWRFFSDDFKKDLRKLGFKVIDTETNFVFITHPNYRAEYIFAELRKRHILVRHYNQERIVNYLRITVGSFDVMLKVLYALKDIVGDPDESTYK